MPIGGEHVIEGWSAYRDHGPRLVGDGGCDVRLGRAGVEQRRSARRCSNGCRSPSASWRSTREGCSRMHRPTRSRCSCGRRRSGPSTKRSTPSSCSRAARQLRARALRRDRAPRVRADPGRAPDPAPSGGRPDRRAASGGRASRLRARPSPRAARCVAARRRPGQGGRRPPARPIRLERPRRSVRSRTRALTAVNCCYCDSS